MEKRIPCTNYACEARGPTQRDGHCCSGTIVYDKASRPRQRFYAELKGSTTERGDCQVVMGLNIAEETNDLVKRIAEKVGVVE